MKHAKNIFAATLILISASVSMADCTQRPGSGMFAHTVAKSSVKVAQPVQAVTTSATTR
jgi:hypothetical protein